MKKNKRVLTLLCVLILAAALFTGCSNNNSAASDSPSTAPTATEQPTQSTAPQDAYVYKMPIADTMYTISAWRSYTSNYLTSPNEILANKELEKRTNIHLEYKLAASAEGQTQYNLMIQSGDYTDIIFQGTQGATVTYAGGFDKGIDDGVFMELTDVVNKWMPNLKTYLENDDIRKGFVLDSGRIGAIVNVQTEGGQPPFLGPAIRVDLLNKVGITEVPKTYDEMYIALKKFKNDLNIEQPLIISQTGINGPGNGLTAGFNMSPYFYNENGTVKFGLLEQNCKDYLTMMNQWYTEGLIDRDFYTRTDTVIAMDRMSTDKVGASEAILYTFPHVYKAMSGNPDYHLLAIPHLRKNLGDELHFVGGTPITGGTYIVVTTAVTDTERLEKIARWIDYRFTEEGAILLNYGVEGDTFNMVDGKPVFSEKITKDPDGTSSMDMMRITTDSDYGAIYDWTREKAVVSDEEWSFYDLWGNAGKGDWVMPGRITLTAEEGAEYSRLYNDINTYITETAPLFIMGDKPLSEYDAFVAQLKSMNIERCIEIQQGALDRYLAR
jgi:putative aldouronate transport system substrate-binding protein